MRTLAWIVALLLLSAAVARAQNVRVTRELTQSSDVYDVRASHDGVYVATSGGALFVDANGTTHSLSQLAGLPGTRARSVSPVTNGVWVAYVEGVAFLTRDATNVHSVARVLSLPRVTRVVEMGATTWFASHGSGLYRLDANSDTPREVRLGSSHARRRLTDLLVVGNELWVASSGAGLFRLNQEGRQRARLSQGNGLPTDTVNCLALDRDRVWIGTVAGVSVAHIRGAIVTDARGQALMHAMRIPDVRAIAVDAERVLVATWGAGMLSVTPRASVARIGGAGANGRSIALFGGRAFLASDEGVLRTSDNGHELESVDAGALVSTDITSLACTSDALWLGTFSRGIVRLERSGSSLRVSAPRWSTTVLDRRINDLAVTRDAETGEESLWIATDRGLFRGDHDRLELVVAPGAPQRVHVTSLHVSRSGDLWVASGRELARFSHGAWHNYHGDEGHPFEALQVVSTDAEGRVWAGGMRGLLLLDAESGEVTRFGVATASLPVDWVTALVPTADGLLIGTYHGGVVRMTTRTREGPSFTVVESSAWVNVHALAAIGDRIFVGTLERGLVSGANSRFTTLTIADGLPSNDVTSVLVENENSAWVATRGGLARVHF